MNLTDYLEKKLAATSEDERRLAKIASDQGHNLLLVFADLQNDGSFVGPRRVVE